MAEELMSLRDVRAVIDASDYKAALRHARLLIEGRDTSIWRKGSRGFPSSLPKVDV